MNRFYLAILFLACSSPAFGQTVLPPGNGRDPLNAHFAAGVPAKSPYTEMIGDARLNDICFVNSRRGWAVGDRGAVWTTHDGGEHWHLQATPIDCTLRSVQFLDESFGIAVGYYWFPASRSCAGRGVILTTRDGGTSWKLRHTPDLPPLYRVKMFDAMTMIVAGAASERFPGGLLLSRDGGETWRPAAPQLSDGFTAIDFYDPHAGIGVGFHGILQQFQGNITASQPATFGHRHIFAVKTAQERGGVSPPAENREANANPLSTGWAVGERGLILSSIDRGYRWGVAPGALPGNAAEVVDLKTIESHGTNLWVAGNPGTAIYKSGDAGRTWKSSLTGTSATIRKIVFFDENTGWAVGDLGTILSTQNGGETWSVQRTGSTKLAMLGLFGDAESIPFEVYAALSANQGFLGGCMLLFRNEQNSSEWEDRLHESILRVGGSLGSELGSFPMLPRELWTTAEKLAEHIQRETDGRGMAQLRERLVAAIRQWKPEILITSNYTNPYTDSAAEALALREVMEAAKLAGDPTAYPHHLTELGLASWKVKKIYLTMKNGALGDVHLTTSEPTARFGMPLEEMSYISRNLAGAKKCPPIVGFLNVSPNTPENPTISTQKNFFAGIPLEGNDGRRTSLGLYTDLQGQHRLRAKQRRNVLGILQSTAQSTAAKGKQPVSQANLAAHAADLTRKLDPESAVQILLDMAEQFHQTGNWNVASDTYLILTRNYARHPLARQAFIRLMQYFASGEIIDGELREDGVFEEKHDWIADPRNPAYRTLQTSLVKVRPVQGQSLIDQQHERALLLGQFLERTLPDLAEDAAMRFAVASVLRKSGWEQESDKFYQTRGNLRFDDVWGMRARTEHWLSLPNKSELAMEQQELPMPAMVCTYTPVKPFVEGVFDTEKNIGIWQRSQLYSLTPAAPRKRLSELLKDDPAHRVGTVREERLRSLSRNFGTQVMLMHDAVQWYIALRCPKVPGFVYPPPAGRQRIRNAVTPDQDRVEILIDIDRDYTTYYSLTIDSRGWVTEKCLGNRNWNPEWHVARHEDSEAWYIEAAIPFAELSQHPMTPDTIWGLAIRRLVPGVGIECWNAENSFELTEGFGLLVFP